MKHTPEWHARALESARTLLATHQTATTPAERLAALQAHNNAMRELDASTRLACGN